MLRVSASQPGAAVFPPPATYIFSYALGEGGPRALASGEARYLATEVAGGFTGVYLALYATANGGQHPEGTRPPADFDWYEYRASGWCVPTPPHEVVDAGG
jgi:xylan 1,4-beta-xylosidase